MIAVVIFISCLYDSFNEFVHGGRPERILRPLPPPLPSSLQSCSSFPSICFFSIIIIIITDVGTTQFRFFQSRAIDGTTCLPLAALHMKFYFFFIKSLWLGEASRGYGPRPPLIGRNIDESNGHIACVAILWHHHYSHTRQWQLAQASIVGSWVDDVSDC